MALPVINASAVTKCFRVPSERKRSLKEATIDLIKGHRARGVFTALDDVTLKVDAAQTVGIVGANGSGKSTLFRILCGVLRPTSGTVSVRGRVSPLIELTAGFHPELSGFENVYLNGAIYGFSRAEIRASMPLIEEFAGIGEFISYPVRTYSSGMMARLGFAVAINVAADILLIDEVLAVGDAQFQGRCLEKVEELRRSGTTIVFVSHDMAAVRRICDRAIMLDHGRVCAQGPPDAVVEAYLARPEGAQP